MGWLMDIISRPLGLFITWCNNLTGNYVFTLVLFSFVLQILLLPFAIKQQKNSIKQAKLDPKVKAIRKKYAGRSDQATQQKMNSEIMELYQRENFNPMGGCLPLLIQMPILFAIYNVVTKPLTYICNFSTTVIDELKNTVFSLLQNMESGVAKEIINSENLFKAFEKGVADPTKVADFTESIREINLVRYIKDLGADNFIVDGTALTAESLPNFSLFGMDLTYSPSEMLWPLGIITVLTLVFTFGSQWITRKFSYNPNAGQEQDKSMKIMMWSMPLLSVFIAHTYAGAVGLYWIIRNIFTTIQTVVLAMVMPIPRFTEEDYKAAEKEVGVKASKKEKKEQKKVRSLHRIEEEDDIDESDSNENNDGKAELREGVKEEDAPKLKDESDRKVKDDTVGE